MGARSLIFLLASSSIACLLLDFYHLCAMRLSTPFLFSPCCVLLFGLAMFDRQRGDGQLFRAIVMGTVGGLLAAIAYDLFRLPFVFAKPWGLARIIPSMDLFKVFPGFGALILGEPVEQNNYSQTARVLGWLYHFSNGATFGVMYVAMIGNPIRRHWAWAVLMAVALEIGMLITPYPAVFHIAITNHFILVTLCAHGIFGVGLGLTVRCLGNHSRI
jgi:hypothetical protein